MRHPRFTPPQENGRGGRGTNATQSEADCHITPGMLHYTYQVLLSIVATVGIVTSAAIVRSVNILSNLQFKIEY
jgi:hypothetical protein